MLEPAQLTEILIHADKRADVTNPNHGNDERSIARNTIEAIDELVELRAKYHALEVEHAETNRMWIQAAHAASVLRVDNEQMKKTVAAAAVACGELGKRLIDFVQS